MSKSKQPILSMGATGSIADSLTFRRSRGVNVAESKPKLPYSLTLAQQYQRWLYQDYAYLWTQQSAATKAIYAAKAARHHTTPIAEWLRYYLTNLPDIAAGWHLDNQTGSTTPDWSRNSCTATIYGPTYTPGRIAGARYCDGVDDYFTAPCSWSATEYFTFELFYTPAAGYGDHAASILIGKGNPALRINKNTGKFFFRVYNHLTAEFNVIDSAPLTVGVTYHLAGLIDATDNKLKLYKNGALSATGDTFTGTLIDSTSYNLDFGGVPSGERQPKGTIDEIRVTTRPLDATELLRHALRRYP